MPEPVVRMVDIHKSYGHVRALHGVSIEAHASEVVGLVGDNGAGKSTLARILAGAIQPDKGEIHLGGKRVTYCSPQEARKQGVSIVYQDTGLIPLMDITRNFFLGKEIVRKIGPIHVLDKKRMRQETIRGLKEVGIASIRDIDARVGVLSGGERQAIKIGRVLFFNAKVVVLDEPMRALSVKEVGKVAEVVMKLQEEGVSIIYITHNIFHIYRVATRFVVLDKGMKVGDLRKEDITEQQLMDIIRTGSTQGIIE